MFNTERKPLADAKANGRDYPTNSDITTAFRITHKDLTLISAVIDSGNGISILPNKDAQSGLDAELKFFALVDDTSLQP